MDISVVYLLLEWYSLPPTHRQRKVKREFTDPYGYPLRSYTPAHEKREISREMANRLVWCVTRLGEL